MKQTYLVKRGVLLGNRWFDAGSKVELLACEAYQLSLTGHLELVVSKTTSKKGAE